MGEIKNIHDKLVKEKLSQKEIAIDFLENYLPKELLEIINLNKIEILKDSYVTGNLEEYFSDILYKVKIEEETGYVYVLFEHKSYYDKDVGLQLLEYMIQCWQRNKKSKEKLPVILPIVIYHGKEKWQKGNKLSDILEIKDERLRKYVPDFEYIFYDICRYSEKEIIGKTEIKLLLRLLKYGSMESLKEELKTILELLKEVTEDAGKFKTYMLYIIEMIEMEPEKLAKIVSKELSKEGGDLVMTTAQILMERGKQEGILEGRQEGIKEGERKGLLEGIELGLDIKFGKTGIMLMNLIREIKEIEKLEKIKERIRKADKLEEVEELLIVN